MKFNLAGFDAPSQVPVAEKVAVDVSTLRKRTAEFVKGLLAKPDVVEHVKAPRPNPQSLLNAEIVKGGPRGYEVLDGLAQRLADPTARPESVSALKPEHDRENLLNLTAQVKEEYRAAAQYLSGKTKGSNTVSFPILEEPTSPHEIAGYVEGFVNREVKRLGLTNRVDTVSDAMLLCNTIVGG